MADITLSDLKIFMKADDQTAAAVNSASRRLGDFEKKSASTTERMLRHWQSYRTVVLAASAALAAAAAASAYYVKQDLAMADAIGKHADSIGISTKALQQYRYIADLSGVSQDVLDKSLQKFTKTIGEAKAGTGALTTFLNYYNKGLLANLQGTKTSEEALNLLFNALAAETDQTKRAALAAAVFGRAGSDMTIMVRGGLKDLEAARQRFKELGLEINEAGIRQAEAANDAIADLTKTVKAGLTNSILALAPEITQVAENTANWVAANRELIAQKVENTVKSIYTDVKQLKDLWDSIPDDAKGPAGFGLLGTLLLGGTGGAWMATIAAFLHDMARLPGLFMQGADEINRFGLSVRNVISYGTDWAQLLDRLYGDPTLYYQAMQLMNSGIDLQTAKYMLLGQAAAKAAEATKNVAAPRTDLASPPIDIDEMRRVAEFQNQWWDSMEEARMQATSEKQATAANDMRQRIMAQNEWWDQQELQRVDDIYKKQHALQVEYEGKVSALKQSAANNAVGLLQVLGAKSKVAAVAALAIQKGLAISQTFVSGKAAEIRAIAELGPAAGIPMAAAIRAWTYVNMALIAAQGLTQATSLGASPPAAGGTAGEPLPASERMTPYEKEAYGSGWKPGQGQQGYQIIFNVNGDINDTEKFTEKVGAAMQKHFSDPGAPLTKLMVRRANA